MISPCQADNIQQTTDRVILSFIPNNTLTNFLAKAEIGLLTLKYHCPALGIVTDQFINQVALSCNDPGGHKNYIYAFLEAADANLKHVEEIIECEYASASKTHQK